MLRPLNPRKTSGFSLVEAMIVLAVLGIAMGIAFPGFQALIANSKVRTAAEGILTGLKLARAEAIRLNTEVSFTLTDDAGWTVATVSPAGDIQVRPKNEAGSNVTVTSAQDQASVTFLSTGRVKNYNADSNLTRLTIASTGAVSTLQIDVLAGGVARMCSPAVTSADDPRKC